LPKHWRDIAEPVFERGWYFCGEHTHSKYRGTVHGAYLSGIDAASALMQNIKEDDW
jgi:monoamine oxidase